jgi:prepilin-type processing-associated H-X9-DG protein
MRNSTRDDLPNRIECLNGRSGPELTGVIQTICYRGGNWLAGNATYSGFHTIHPPNSPACTRTGTSRLGDWGLYPPSSYHPGGVNSVFFDGSCRWISETINFGTATAYFVGITMDGPSEFGVWGAMGTPDGGESVAMP